MARLFGRRDEEALPLYEAVVARARRPHWYEAGAVLDTIDGRFDMVAAILAFVLLRLERDPAAAGPSARLTERFIEDMDAQLRQIGIGDVTVGKHVGKMMSMLGGRIGAYREGLANGNIDAALARNLYRGEAPAAESLAHSRAALLALRDALATTPTAAIVRGELP